MFSKNIVSLMICALAGASAFTLSTHTSAETVTRTTTVVTTPETQLVDFETFDLNGDGIVSRREIGDEVFGFYDLDKNNLLDAEEYQHMTRVTIQPGRRKVVHSIDLNDDGVADVTEYKYENVASQSRLYYFEHKKEGLTANDFIGSPFASLDADSDTKIAREEWYKAYINQLDSVAASPTQNEVNMGKANP